jgi:hypothetical protein
MLRSRQWRGQWHRAGSALWRGRVLWVACCPGEPIVTQRSRAGSGRDAAVVSAGGRSVPPRSRQACGMAFASSSSPSTHPPSTRKRHTDRLPRWRTGSGAEGLRGPVRRVRRRSLSALASERWAAMDVTTRRAGRADFPPLRLSARPPSLPSSSPGSLLPRRSLAFHLLGRRTNARSVGGLAQRRETG